MILIGTMTECLILRICERLFAGQVRFLTLTYHLRSYHRHLALHLSDFVTYLLSTAAIQPLANDLSPLNRTDIVLTPTTLSEFVSFLSNGKEALASDHLHSKQISWVEFRDMLLMLPRSASVPEIYKVRRETVLIDDPDPTVFWPIVDLTSHCLSVFLSHAHEPLIQQFYQVRKRYPDGRGAARVNSEGDLSPSFPNPPPSPTKPKPPPSPAPQSDDSSDASSSSQGSSSNPPLHLHRAQLGRLEMSLIWTRRKRRTTRRIRMASAESSPSSFWRRAESQERVRATLPCLTLMDSLSRRFCSYMPSAAHALGSSLPWVASLCSAVSRTATAPFDRLKVFLITDSTPSSTSDVKPVLEKTFSGIANLKRAVMRLYLNGGGVRAFWVGNGLNV